MKSNITRFGRKWSLKGATKYSSGDRDYRYLSTTRGNHW